MTSWGYVLFVVGVSVLCSAMVGAVALWAGWTVGKALDGFADEAFRDDR